MNASDLVICTVGLSKSFGAVPALKSLDLQVPQKSIFAFLGPNGAGKTTTIKLLLDLLRPTRGSGTILGRDIVRDSVDIRARIGYLPQDPRFYEPVFSWWPLIATVVSRVVFVAAAIWHFYRQEF